MHRHRWCRWLSGYWCIRMRRSRSYCRRTRPAEFPSPRVQPVRARSLHRRWSLLSLPLAPRRIQWWCRRRWPRRLRHTCWWWDTRLRSLGCSGRRSPGSTRWKEASRLPRPRYQIRSTRLPRPPRMSSPRLRMRGSAPDAGVAEALAPCGSMTPNDATGSHSLRHPRFLVCSLERSLPACSAQGHLERRQRLERLSSVLSIDRDRELGMESKPTTVAGCTDCTSCTSQSEAATRNDKHLGCRRSTALGPEYGNPFDGCLWPPLVIQELRMSALTAQRGRTSGARRTALPF